MEVEDENGRKLNDQEIIDVLVMYLNAGHESSGHIIMWAIILLQQHPEILDKAKVASQYIRLIFDIIMSASLTLVRHQKKARSKH